MQVCCTSHSQSFFGFGQSADIDIVLDGAESRKMTELKSEDGKRERYYLFYDGESVNGKVGSVFFCVPIPNPPTPTISIYYLDGWQHISDIACT